MLQDPPTADDLPRLSALQDELSEKLIAAIALDPQVREDETWGNCGALLDHLAQLSGRPWRDPAPDPLALLTLAAETLSARLPWEERLATLGAHPLLGNYKRTAQLFRRLEKDRSAEVERQMKRLKQVLGKPKDLPRRHWWTTQAPDWVKEWFRTR